MSGEIPSRIEQIIRIALAREPIALGEESIGRHFRNAEEIADLQELLAELYESHRAKDVLSVGLIGSRTQGRFTYSVEELFWKLIYRFKQTPAFDLDEEELDWILVSRDWQEVVSKIPERIFEDVLPLARFLREQASLHTNLSNINLEALPPELKKFVTVEATYVPPRYWPASAKETYLGPDAKITPAPGAYYPDVDVLAITAEGAREIGGAVLGRRSGTSIEVNSTPRDEESLRAEELLSTFRPIILSGS